MTELTEADHKQAYKQACRNNPLMLTWEELSAEARVAVRIMNQLYHEAIRDLKVSIEAPRYDPTMKAVTFTLAISGAPVQDAFLQQMRTAAEISALPTKAHILGEIRALIKSLGINNLQIRELPPIAADDDAISDDLEIRTPGYMMHPEHQQQIGDLIRRLVPVGTGWNRVIFSHDPFTED